MFSIEFFGTLASGFFVLMSGLLFYQFTNKYNLKFGKIIHTVQKDKIKHLFNPSILKCKILLVFILSTVAILSLPILVTKGNVHFKHALEWNYFVGVIFFYLLSFLFWKKVQA